MKIETLADWNLILAGCGCCPMPECPVPTRECESISAELCGISLPTHPSNTTEEECIVFQTKTAVETVDISITEPGEDTSGPDYSLTQFETKTYATSYSYVDGECVSQWSKTEVSSSLVLDPAATFGSYVYTKRIAWEYTTTQTEGGSPVIVGTWTEQDTDFQNGDPDGPITTLTDDEISGVLETPTVSDFTPDSSWSKSGFAYSKAISADSSVVVTYSNPSSGEDSLTGLDFPDDATGTSCIAQLSCTDATKTRFRWLIPDTWEGSYFKITWDEVTFPADESTPTVVNADKTWTWEGPGDPEDADSWKSGWYALAPPSEPGEVRVVNVRFECYTSAKFGTRPQTTGEAYEDPEP
jgi:hypothetical protein